MPTDDTLSYPYPPPHSHITPPPPPPPPSSRTGWGLTTFSFRRGASQDELPLRRRTSCLLLLHLNQCTNRIQGIICRLLSRRLAISHAVLQLRVIEKILRKTSTTYYLLPRQQLLRSLLDLPNTMVSHNAVGLPRKDHPKKRHRERITNQLKLLRRCDYHFFCPIISFIHSHINYCKSTDQKL